MNFCKYQLTEVLNTDNKQIRWIQDPTTLVFFFLSFFLKMSCSTHNFFFSKPILPHLLFLFSAFFFSVLLLSPLFFHALSVLLHSPLNPSFSIQSSIKSIHLNTPTTVYMLCKIHILLSPNHTIIMHTINQAKGDHRLMQIEHTMQQPPAPAHSIYCSICTTTKHFKNNEF